MQFACSVKAYFLRIIRQKNHRHVSPESGKIIGLAPCENLSSAHAFAQSDQDLHCLLRESLDTTECMESKDPDDTLRMPMMT